MQLYIVVYSHRHGMDAWLSPTNDLTLIAKSLDDFEPERGEYLELFGAVVWPPGSDEGQAVSDYTQAVESKG